MQAHTKRGEVIFREGDPPTLAYLIEQGRVEVCTETGGERVVLAILGPGDLLGEMAIIDASPRTATATALDDCVLMPVAREQIQERLAGADPIIRGLLQSQLSRYRSALDTFRTAAPERDGAPAGAPCEAVPGLDKMRLDTQLREALEQRALEVCYQPIWDIALERITGYEALIRWQHPDHGPVSPESFIGLAEETSLIVPVGRYVFDTVVDALVRLRSHWPAATELPFVAVNVSARQLEDAELLEYLQALTQRAGVPTRCIKLEITESLTLDIARAKILLDRCHAIGVRVALDDFGTGYSNLGQLHELRFDTVKLDRGFVRQMLHEPRCFSIVQAIVLMIAALDADIVAEGVESNEQLHALREMGCRYAQGYLIGKPEAAMHPPE